MCTTLSGVNRHRLWNYETYTVRTYGGLIRTQILNMAVMLIIPKERKPKKPQGFKRRSSQKRRRSVANATSSRQNSSSRLVTNTSYISIEQSYQCDTPNNAENL